MGLTARVGTRAVTAALAVTLLATTGCTTSKVASDAAVTLTGSVQDANGIPVTGTRVVLLKEADFGEIFSGAVIAISTLGLSCLVGQAPSFCARAPHTTTDAAGSFSFHLKGADTQGSVGNADSFDVAAAGTNVRFRIQRTQLAIPTLRTWGEAVSLSTAGGLDSVVRPDLPAAYGGSPTYAVNFTDATAGQPVWTVSPAQRSVSVDTRVLEDRHGTVEADARTRQAGPDTSFDFTYRSQTAAFSGPGAAPSRGAACTSGGPGQAPRPLQPCGLTDGNLFASAPLPRVAACAACTPPVLSEVTLDLGTLRPVSLVVVRGSDAALAVEASVDGAAWTPVGTTSGDPSAVTAAAGLRARYVRLRTPTGLGIETLKEVSVWN